MSTTIALTFICRSEREVHVNARCTALGVSGFAALVATLLLVSGLSRSSA
jgi:hypothetical protein